MRRPRRLNSYERPTHGEWNDLCDQVYRLTQFHAHAPLKLDNLNGVMALSLSLVPMRLLVVNAKATTPGCYRASTWQPAAAPLDFTQTTAFTSSQLGQSADDTVYLVNESEMFRSPAEPQQWDLSYILDLGYSPLAHGVFHSVAKDGNPVYLFFGVALENCSPSS